jgi:hypothetical protein
MVESMVAMVLADQLLQVGLRPGLRWGFRASTRAACGGFRLPG